MLTIFVLVTLISIPSCKKQEEKVIKIGAILPLTGPGASFGQYVKEGIDLAVNEIFKKDKVKINIYYEDSKNQPKVGLSAYNKLISMEKLPVVIVALSSVASALSPLASKTKTVQIYVDVAKPGVTDGEYTFRIYPEAHGTAGVIAKFSRKFLAAKTAAIFHIDDSYGLASKDIFVRLFEEQGGKVIFEERYSISQREFKSSILKLSNLPFKPDVIYLNGYGQSFVILAKSLRTLYPDIQLVADVAFGLPENFKSLGNLAEGSYYVDIDLSDEFVKSFEETYNKEPSSDAAFAYDIIYILYNIYKTNKQFNVKILQKSLKRINYFGAVGPITINKEGNANLKFVVKKVLKKGKVQNVKW